MPKYKNDQKNKKCQDTLYTQNREISWLRFNERVLDEATDKNVPLYERLKFISIFTSNLDEFFMVRVGSLTDLSMIKQPPIDSKTGKTPTEQLNDIFKIVPSLYEKRYKTYCQVEQAFRQHDIYHLNYEELSKKEKDFVKKHYNNFIKPVLSPQIIDFHHPFPHLINNELYIVTQLSNKSKGILYGIVPVPTMLSKMVIISKSNFLRYMLTENVILQFINQEFPMYEIMDKSLIRVTRNADINPDDEQYDVDDDYRHHIKKVLKTRSRLCPVRLEFYNNISNETLNFLCENLNLKKQKVFKSKSPLSMNYVFSIGDHMPKSTRKAISYESFSPAISPFINPNESMIKQAIKNDMLLFYPYQKMDSFINLIKDAAIDPNVISIKITIYRLANNSKLVDYLKLAVENKKEVVVLIELRARFDEESNIQWSNELEESGCKILYGFERYKVHSKICLITMKGKNKIQYITQIGTGNYNEQTAKIYTDLCFITANQSIGKDACLFFQNMSISNLYGEYSKLLVSPSNLKSKILSLIDDEIKKGHDGNIFMKMNSITDIDIINKLSEASNSGVNIKLNIRGICCILPGIEGKTQNIEITSIVGRFLEHPRIYCFGKTIDDIKIYIGSADMMTRNTEKRVEILVPIENITIKKHILNIINIINKDNVKARKIRANGKLEKFSTENNKIKIDSQSYFLKLSKSYLLNKQSERENIITYIKNIKNKLIEKFKKSK